MRVFLQDFALVSTSAYGNIREDTIEVSGYANVVPDGAELGKRSDRFSSDRDFSVARNSIN